MVGHVNEVEEMKSEVMDISSNEREIVEITDKCYCDFIIVFHQLKMSASRKWMALEAQKKVLTITVVAGLLSKCDDVLHRIKQVAQDVKSAILKDPGQQCEKVLALSYCYLPQRLKGCFLYFEIFPEDYAVNVKRLTNLWVENDSKSLEDRAEECFHELVERNVVLVTGRQFLWERKNM
ncbi:probable disease resistance RPP8-like protein 2 [Capsicum annuum]|uniref:probable disease resistance RPP8-like protein 2 n=1 Tax=Capsicum annuum TaxID=4072 RepID=UPI001FB092A0|nr:probable disease resistance RPP8-like protein 2 [Capsicum annuum]